jgi:carbamoyl-phosphate synthase large subunit
MQEQTNDEEYVLCSISDRAKEESLPTVKELANNQFKFAATEGTAEFLQKNGIIVEEIIKNSDQLNQLYRNQKIRAVINIPNEGRNDSKFGFYLREQSVKYNVPCYTHFDTVKAIIELRKNKPLETGVYTVGEYFKIEESKIGGAL